jgi:rubredoxin
MGHNIWRCSKCGKQESFHPSIDDPNKPGKNFEELKDEWENEEYGKSGPSGFDEFEARGAGYFAEWLDHLYRD